MITEPSPSETEPPGGAGAAAVPVPPGLAMWGVMVAALAVLLYAGGVLLAGVQRLVGADQAVSRAPCR